MGLMEQGVGLLRNIMMAHVAVDQIIYHRGILSVTLTKKAWIGRTQFRLTDETGSFMYWNDRDYLIPVNVLILNGNSVTPQKGDWIEQVLPQGTITFEIAAPENEQLWRYSDPQQTILRIHTKKMI